MFCKRAKRQIKVKLKMWVRVAKHSRNWRDDVLFVNLFLDGMS